MSTRQKSKPLVNTAWTPLYMPDYADIILPEEREAMRAWLDQTLAAIRATAAPSPQATLRRLCQRGFDGAYYRGLARNGQPLRLKGTVYPTGIGMATGTALRVELPAPGRRFTCRVGVQDSNAPANGKPARFHVETEDGQSLWNSRPLLAGDEPAAVEITLTGGRVLILKAEGPEQHVDWVDVRVELEDGRVCILGEPRRQGACFDFAYDGRPCRELLHTWTLAEETLPAERGIARRRITRTDPATGLALILELAVDEAFPAVEWILRLRNTGAADSPLIADVRSFQFIQPADLGYIFINTTRGDPARWDSYSPCRHAIGSHFYGQREAVFDEYAFAPVGGRSTDAAWPYFRVEFSSTGGGVFAAVGWPGQWQAHASRDTETFRLTAGQQLTRFRLRPGEEVRAPLSALLFWRGNDTMRAQNLWRRWMLARNLPRPGGQLPAPMLSGSSWPFTDCMVDATTAQQKQFLDLCEQRRLPIDHWWMDAGWYRQERTYRLWEGTGTLEVDRKRFPEGIRAISDHARARRIKTILWFEPERVAAGSWLAENKPEWLLRSDASEWRAFDLGNPEARAWLIERVDRMIADEGIDVYRQDFNFPPLDFWRGNDAPERQGITEMHYVEGLLAFWDELRRRHPHLLIDECAAGGRRNDLECMRRAVPLHRTDLNYADQAAKQSMTHGLSAWLPFSGTNVLPFDKVDPYVFRSAWSLGTSIAFDVRREDLDYDLLRRLIDERQRLIHYLYGDYYPLTQGGPSEAEWIAWQFHRPDLEEGMLQVFRRTDSPFETGRFRLRGLEPEAVYEVVDLDQLAAPTVMGGRELMETGLTITMREIPQAMIVHYKRVRQGTDAE